eukprot:gb/GECG01015230.1/.p1 GENE.gb/GECG01015230.1/~~gb/GECG01015230.1/.p1  ORF type:complete len:2060 (+),score=282.85 gb/GECG01015230.1/:1-6180(+)
MESKSPRKPGGSSAAKGKQGNRSRRKVCQMEDEEEHERKDSTEETPVSTSPSPDASIEGNMSDTNTPGGGADGNDAEGSASSKAGAGSDHGKQQRITSDKSTWELADIVGVKKLSQLKEKTQTLKEVDAFQTQHLRCDTLTILPNLRKATVIQAPSFGRINLPQLGCSKLEHLWLVECNIKKIENLDHLSDLRTLVLDSNGLAEITGLENLVALRKLWINDNKIREIKGLEHLSQLKELSLARNRIEEIGDALDPNQKLEELNLAHNRIGHFKELLSLRRLESMKWLALSDPHWGCNPVCKLCNYQTFVLYQLPQVEVLDTVPVTSDIKNVAEATYMKKHMYYNMRIKTLKRNTTNMIKRARQSLTRHVRTLEKLCSDLYLKRALVRRDIEERVEVHAIFPRRDDWCDMMNQCQDAQEHIRILEQDANKLQYNEISFIKKYRDFSRQYRQAAGADPDSKEDNEGREENKEPSASRSMAVKTEPPKLSVEEKAIMHSLTTQEWDHYLESVRGLEERIRKFQMEAAMLRAQYQVLQERLINIASKNTSRMLLELGTGGNIRLEDGKPSDVWFNSCIDLLKSRFYKRDFAKLGIKGLKVHRVTRIHNRLLRTKFDQRMNTILQKFPELSPALSAESHRSSNMNGSSGNMKSGNSMRRPLEYLFYSPEWEGKSSIRRPEDVLGEIQKISEEGFKKSHATVSVPSPPLVPDVNYAKESLPSYAPKQRRFGKQRSIAELDEQQRAAENVEALNALNSSMQGQNNDNGNNVWTKGVPFSNSLAALDLPRVAEASSSLLEKHTEWKRTSSSPTKSQRNHQNNSSLLNKSVEPSVAGNTASASAARHGGFKMGVNKWLRNAGIDPGDKQTLQLLQSATADDVKDEKPDVPLTEPAVCEGALIICKVFLGNCDTAEAAAVRFSDYMDRLKATAPQAGEEEGEAEQKDFANFHDDDDDDDNNSRASVHSDEENTLPEQLPAALHTVVQEREDDSKQRQWVSIDPVLALPEYIVEYEYVWQGSSKGNQKPSPQDKASKGREGYTSDAVDDELRRLQNAGLKLESAPDDTEAGNINSMQPQEEADLKPLVRAVSSFTNHIDESANRIHSSNSGDLLSWMPKSPMAMRPEDITWCTLLEYQASRMCSVGMPLQKLLTGPVEFDVTVFQRLRYLNLSGCGISSLYLPWTDKINRKEHTKQERLPLTACVPNLNVLVLAFNCLERVPRGSLMGCHKLKKLDISHNLIKTIENESICRKNKARNSDAKTDNADDSARSLTTVLLNHNQISSWEDLGDVLLLGPQVHTFDIRHNPITELHDALPDTFKELSDDERAKILHSSVPGSPSRNATSREMSEALSRREASRIGAESSVQSAYRAMLMRAFRELKCLDGVPVTSESRRKAMDLSTYITGELIRKLSTDRNGDLVWNTTPREESFDALPEEQCLQVYSLEVSRRQLHSLVPIPVSSVDPYEVRQARPKQDTLSIGTAHAPLSKLKRLRKLDASCNELTDMKGVGQLPALESLCLEDNNLEKLEDLESLSNLSILEMGKNKLRDSALKESLPQLSKLTNLVQISLEDNSLSDLKPFGQLTSLMELYLGNNRVSGLKQILHLRGLPRLIILDLAGNPIVQSNNYRLYTVFNLRRLKVLDGLGVDAAESQAAKEEYSGRVNLDFLAEKLNATKFDTYHEIDLSSSQLKEIDVLAPTEFRCLAMLNLDNNLLTGASIKGLRLLPHLSMLNLNGNKIESFFDATQDEFTAEEHDRINEWSQINSPPQRAPPSKSASGAALPAPVEPATVCFPQLEVLNLDNNHITSMDNLYLSSFPELKVLSLAGNSITAISGLNGCSQLRELVLDKNKIRQIDPESFAGAPELCELRIADNALRTLSNIERARNVQTLIVTGNRVSDFSEIDRLTALPNMTELGLASNPISRKHLYRVSVIKKLDLLETLDGIPITEDEKDQGDALYYSEQHQNSQQQPQANGTFELDQAMADRVPLRLQAVELGSQPSARDSPHARPGSIELTGVGYNGGGYQRQQNFLSLESLSLGGAGGMNSGRQRKAAIVQRNNFRKKDFLSR